MTKILQIIAILTILQFAIVFTSYAAPLIGGEPGRGTPYNGGKCGNHHTVQYGETLYSIGRRYGVDPSQIVQANNLYNPDHIYAGQILYIPCSQGYHQPYPYLGGGHYPAVGYGYDFTGYYYETYYPHYRRYSYTCGYHYNCY